MGCARSVAVFVPQRGQYQVTFNVCNGMPDKTINSVQIEVEIVHLIVLRGPTRTPQFTSWILMKKKQ
ncbi:hypothetical protein BHK69_17530 [Bosea vaviloviae]|uniref:Uncharacterized protein n=1 Tax=Bosea vaviloviae TaxID=1526658 RepID=A0A1D7U3Q8_9HYPH|nr:hypothetical protein BHK69_17530 [Bosea vaviloviae]